MVLPTDVHRVLDVADQVLAVRLLEIPEEAHEIDADDPALVGEGLERGVADIDLIVSSNRPGPLPTSLTVKFVAVSPEARASAIARANNGAPSGRFGSKSPAAPLAQHRADRLGE